ncbi:type VI secretion system Vgr family protein [Marinicellulosiphila megalodicopiae]|uniref:type VI secretion system Vgr family protein n=1 Tax=Marinicellulosiphila megalodicopiae TaxID=2724896 RepID=UPI003BB11246
MINFHFKSTAYDDDTFRVLSFSGTETMSSLYQFTINLVSQKPDIEFSKMATEGVQLSIVDEVSGKTRYFNGMVKNLYLTNLRTGGLFEYQLVMVPRIWMKTQVTQNRVFLDKSALDIILDELKSTEHQDGHPILADEDHEGITDSDYEVREYTAQFEESDFDFISRLMEHEGIFYFFEHDDAKEKLIIADGNGDLYSINGDESDAIVPFNSDKEGSHNDNLVVYHFSRFQTHYPKNLIILDKNENRPDLPLQKYIDLAADSDIPGLGHVTEFAKNYKTPEELERIIVVRNQEYLCRQGSSSGEGNNYLFCAGAFFNLQNCYREDFDQKYLLTSVNHRGSQDIITWGNIGNTHYHNTFECIPFTLNYRAQRSTPVPKCNNMIIGTIETAGDDTGRADIDEKGRYKVKMGFDISDAEDGKHSHRIPMAQSYTGENGGIHFPLAPGTEVIIAFLNGDVDRPVIMAGLPNDVHQSVSKTENSTSNIIKTYSGITMSFNDGKGVKKEEESSNDSSVAKQGAKQKIGFVANNNKTPAKPLSVSDEDINTQENDKVDAYQSLDIGLIHSQSNAKLINKQSLTMQQQHMADSSKEKEKKQSKPKSDKHKLVLLDSKTEKDTESENNFSLKVPYKEGLNSYLRMGINRKEDNFSENSQSTEDKEHIFNTENTSWFDYTDGDKLSVTMGEKFELINSGEYDLKINNGDKKTKKQTTFHDSFYHDETDGFKRSTVANVKSDHSQFGDNETYYDGLLCQANTGLNTNINVSGQLKLSYASNVNVVKNTSVSFSYEDTFDYVIGDAHKISKNENIESLEKVQLYVDTSTSSDFKKHIDDLKKDTDKGEELIKNVLKDNAILEIVKSKSNKKDNKNTDTIFALSAAISAAALLSAKDIKGKSTVKGSKSDNSKRASQLVLAKDQLTLATNDGDKKEAADIVLKKDGSMVLENKLKESKMEITKKGFIDLSCAKDARIRLSRKGGGELDINKDGVIILQTKKKKLKVLNDNSNQIMFDGKNIKVKSKEMNVKGKVKLGKAGELSVG